MNNWTEFAVNPEALGIYDTPPSLEACEFLANSLTQSGAVFEINLSISEMPQRRPKRWPAENNAIRLDLQLWSVLSSSFSVSQTSEERIIACVFRKSGTGLLFDCSGPGISGWIECDSMRVAHIEGYIRAERKNIGSTHNAN